MAATTCSFQQIAAPSSRNSRSAQKWTSLSKPSSSSAMVLRQRQIAGIPLRTAAVSRRPAPAAFRGEFHTLAQAVSTTPETEEAEAEAADEATDLVEAEEEAAPEAKKFLVKNLMDLLKSNALAAATEGKNIPNLKPGDVVQLRVEVAENKRRVSLLRGIVIGIHHAGINSTFRIRRVLAGVGVELVFPLYSPNIKELKVVDKRRARRAKLYYLRDKIARLSSC